MNNQNSSGSAILWSIEYCESSIKYRKSSIKDRGLNANLYLHGTVHVGGLQRSGMKSGIL